MAASASPGVLYILRCFYTYVSVSILSIPLVRVLQYVVGPLRLVFLTNATSFYTYPIFVLLKLVCEGLKNYRDAAALGAAIPHEWSGRLVGNYDILRLVIKPGCYPGISNYHPVCTLLTLMHSRIPVGTYEETG